MSGEKRKRSDENPAEPCRGGIQISSEGKGFDFFTGLQSR